MSIVNGTWRQLSLSDPASIASRGYDRSTDSGSPGLQRSDPVGPRTSAHFTGLYPWVGQVWVTGVLGVSQVAGVLGLGVWRGDRMPTLQFQFQIFSYFFSRR